MKSYIAFFVALSGVVLLGAGCISFQSSSTEGDGGVWRTDNRGDEWAQKKVWLSAAGVKNMSSQNVDNFFEDPSDHLAIYAGTTEGGLFYSYDGGESWFQARQLATGRVRSVAVDSRDKCTIYVAMGPRVWKSTDCSRTFSSSYFESRADVVIKQVIVDWFNSDIVYAGSSRGDVLKSTNGGGNWTTVKRLDDTIQTMYMDPFDSRIVYVALKDSGVWKTADGGDSWTDFSESLREFDKHRNVVALVGDKTTEGLLLIAMKYGIMRSADGGETWEALNLLTPPGSVVIRSLAVNPRNGNEIYYGTDSTFYRSANGGADWVTQKLPTKRAPTALIVNSQDSNAVFMGTTLFKD